MKLTFLFDLAPCVGFILLKKNSQEIPLFNYYFAKKFFFIRNVRSNYLVRNVKFLG